MREIIIFLMFLCFSYHSYSQDRSGTDVVYINGIWTLKEWASLELDDVVALNQSSQIDSKFPVKYKLAYNKNEGFFEDIEETLLTQFPNVVTNYYKLMISQDFVPGDPVLSQIQQTLENKVAEKSQHIDEENLDEMITNVFRPTIEANKRILVIGNSQGGIFANRIFDKLKIEVPNFDEKKYNVFYIATPIEEKIKSCSEHRTYNDDHIINAVRLLGNPLPANINSQGSLSYNTETILLNPNGSPIINWITKNIWAPIMVRSNHLLTWTYISGDPSPQFAAIRTSVINGIKDASKDDAFTCSSCENVAPNCTPENSHRYTNPDDSEGGLIGNCVKVHNTDLWIGEDAQVCGDTVIGDEFLAIPGRVKVLDTAIVMGINRIYSSLSAPVLIQGNAFVLGTYINDPSSLVAGASRGTRIEQNAHVEGHFSIDSSVITGNSELRTPVDGSYIAIFNSYIGGSAVVGVNSPYVGTGIENSIVQDNAYVASAFVTNSWIKDTSRINGASLVDSVCMNGASVIESASYSSYVYNVIMNSGALYGDSFVEGTIINFPFTDLNYSANVALSPCVGTLREAFLNDNLMPLATP